MFNKWLGQPPQPQGDVTALKYKNVELLGQLKREQRKRREAEAEVERLHNLLAQSHSALLERLQ